MARPHVSVVIIFLNEERFLEEAICSVFDQSCSDWELLLVDDGSNDGSSRIAVNLAARMPHRVRYLQHDGHANLGMSASRNLGLREAAADFVAYLDADDVWLPTKLECQLALLSSLPDVAMTYGATLYWHSWEPTAADGERDYLIGPGVEAPAVFEPPELLTQFLEGNINMPCMGSMLMRRDAVVAFGGWNEEFPGLFEDQVFFAKLCVERHVLITDRCWDKYRQHQESACAVGIRSGELSQARAKFHGWLAKYLTQHGLHGSATWQALEHQITRAATAVA